MSFTTDVIEELLSVPEGKTCCRKAMLYGLFMSAREYGNQNKIVAEFKTAAVAARAADILKKHFSADADVQKITRAGRVLYSVSVQSKALNNFLMSIDKLDESNMTNAASALIGFRCADCAVSFLRGVFTSCATVNDPTKGFHLEFAFSSAKRASLVADFLSSIPFDARVRPRNGRLGIVFKNNSTVSDILYYLGATQCGFLVANTYIEKNIVNIEKRATNCDTQNIARAVAATHKHVEAIEYLQKKGVIFNLDKSLQYTAKLRTENPSVSLKELALLHNPPITKSGLNGRLAKIIAIYIEEKNK